MTRLVAISDTHTLHGRMTHPIPEEDVIVHAGDFCSRGTEEEVINFSNWFQGLDFEEKIVIAGNHDLRLERVQLDEVKNYFPGITYLHGEAVKVRDLNLWGGPWTPRFCDWAFNVERRDLKPYWDNIPESTHVLVTHGPPMGILDLCPDLHTANDVHVGDQALMDRISELPCLLAHIFGHIHEGYGTHESSGVTFVNASICNRAYKPVNSPIVLDL